MKKGGSWMPKWKRAYIRKAARLRYKLTNKVLAQKLGVELKAVEYHSKEANRGLRGGH